MATRYIYLSHELNEKLKAEANASALIVSLLEEHYKDTRTEEQIIEDTKKKAIELEEQKKIKEKRDRETEELKKALLEEIEK